ncbi:MULTISPECIES: ATP-dependent zinc metalloprotease FtsH [unclassified Clostridium]|uniref:ATP-dependent zinc metalloprotease FtsH n=1 Tax=unclassified Clostridium TaxID=2614128 RepID=UPI0024308E41|nr:MULTISPECIES: ATP-dependent zinc metalloprotease FtsH [unclassified Clostridium]
MKKIIRGPGFFVLLILVIVLMSTLFGSFSFNTQTDELNYNTEFLELVKEDKIAKVAIVDNTLVGLYKESKIREADFPNSYDFKTMIPNRDLFFEHVSAIKGGDANDPSAVGFTIDILPTPEPSIWSMLLPYIVMAALFGLLWFFIMRQQNAGGNSAMSFGKSRARLQTPEDKKRVTFQDVAGEEEEKEELVEIVEFLKNPKIFMELGARIPKGVLLVGPPGTGKTLLAKAVAGEAGVPFFSISGSDFVEMFVGVGASRVRDLFNEAKKNLPCIVFIDEIDAVGRQRGAGLGGGHDEREQTLNQLLVEMDGFAVNEGIIILAATNRADILDPALLRPGRFDRQIYVNYPDVKGREEILKVHMRGKPLASDVDLPTLARLTPYFTGADLENVLNEAAILAARRHKKEIGMDEVKEAISRVSMGPEKRSRVVIPKDKKLVAYHEAGHAVVARALPNCDPVHEVSIIPRGMAGGYTQTLPDEDTSYISKGKLLDLIAMAMGGNAAEKLIFDDVSTGATSDLQHATDIARKMVTEYGMSDAIGPVYLSDSGHEVFLGRDFSPQHKYSEAVAAKIDKEMRDILEKGYAKAEEVINANRDRLERIVSALIEHEKLDRAMFEALWVGELLPSGDQSGEEELGDQAPEAGELPSAEEDKAPDVNGGMSEAGE